MKKKDNVVKIGDIVYLKGDLCDEGYKMLVCKYIGNCLFEEMLTGENVRVCTPDKLNLEDYSQDSQLRRFTKYYVNFTTTSSYVAFIKDVYDYYCDDDNFMVPSLGSYYDMVRLAVDWIKNSSLEIWNDQVEVYSLNDKSARDEYLTVSDEDRKVDIALLKDKQYKIDLDCLISLSNALSDIENIKERIQDVETDCVNDARRVVSKRKISRGKKNLKVHRLSKQLTEFQNSTIKK